MSEAALQIAKERKDTKGKGEKERYTYLNAEFPRIARGDRDHDHPHGKEMQKSKMAV